MTKKTKQMLTVFLIRWWAIGAVYFLIGWGTPLGRFNSLIDLIFFLGLAIGIINTFFVNPVLKMLYNIGWHKSYGSSTFGERFICRAKDISLGIVSAVIVMGIYQGINSLAISLFSFPEDQIFLPGEPILFGLFYTFSTTALLKLISLFGKKE